MDEKSIKSITDEITSILLKKNQDYGGASFDLGLNGNMVHLWDKVKRYRNLIETNKEVNYENLSDTLKDIIGYSIIGLHILNDQSITNKINGDKNNE
jgi:hypothetical protein